MENDFFCSLPKHLQEKIELVEIFNPKEILVSSYWDWTGFGVTREEVDFIKNRAADFLCPCSDQILKKCNLTWKKVALGCEGLDNLMNGGFVSRGIIEICGEAGSGKTQICLQLALMAQISLDKNINRCKKVIYLCTEEKFPVIRLKQMIDMRNKEFNVKSNHNFMDNVLIKNIKDNKDLLDTVKNQIPKIIKSNEYGLIVIDSIAGCYRTEFNWIQRANELRDIVNVLLKLINEFEFPVVCTNQMTQVDDTLIPALGLAWSNLVRTRYQIYKTKNYSENDLIIRKMQVIYSPEIKKCRETNFLITEAGIIDVPKMT